MLKAHTNIFLMSKLMVVSVAPCNLLREVDFAHSTPRALSHEKRTHFANFESVKCCCV